MCSTRHESGTGLDVTGLELHRPERRLHRLPGRSLPALLRRRPRPVVPAPHDGVPLAAGPAEGRDHEPAVDRRRLRYRRRDLPVGLGRRRVRRVQRSTDRAVHSDDALRHRLRPVDGLRGLPPLADEGGVRPHGRQRQRGGRRPRGHRPSHHSGGGHHGRRLRLLRAGGRPDSSSSSALGLAVRCSSTPRSCACCSSRRRWNCSAIATGGCRRGSTASCPVVHVEAPPEPVNDDQSPVVGGDDGGERLVGTG